MEFRRTHPFSWPLTIDAVWLAMPLFVVAIRTLLQPIPMEDYWWHLVMGRLIEVSGSIPDSNTFIYTLPADAPFYDQPWLGQWLMFKIATVGGHVATVLAHAALLLTAWLALCLFAFRRGASPVVIGVGASFAHYISASTLMPRTQMFAYLPFVLLVGLLLHLLRRGPSKPSAPALLALVGVTVFWANVHGTFVLAPVLTGAAAVGWALERRRRGDPLLGDGIGFWVAAVAAVILGAAVAPGGIHNLFYPFNILGATKATNAIVLEWAPPGLYFQGILFYLALAASTWLLARRRSELLVGEALLFAAVAAVALLSTRGVLWWSIVALLVAGPQLTALRSPAPRPPTRGAESALNLALLAALFVLAMSAIPGGPLFRVVDPAALFGEGRLMEEGDGAVFSESHPAFLVEALRTTEGHLFHDQSAGGFLEWMLTTGEEPRPVAFVDQRLELLPDTLWDEYFDISRARPGWQDAAEKHEIRRFLVHAVEQQLLAAELDKSPRYELIAEDRMWRLYVMEETSGSSSVHGVHQR